MLNPLAKARAESTGKAVRQCDLNLYPFYTWLYLQRNNLFLRMVSPNTYPLLTKRQMNLKNAAQFLLRVSKHISTVEILKSSAGKKLVFLYSFSV